MPTLRADENRYLLFAEPWERAKVRRIPGGRWSAAPGCWVFAPQAALVGALDRVFQQGWTAEGAVELEVTAARQRSLAPPKHTAQATLEGTRLAVQCHFDDRDLVKLVPGYRWSSEERRWFLDALPLALDILEDAFGPALHVSDEASAYIDLKRLDETRQDSGGPPEAATPTEEPVSPRDAASPPETAIHPAAVQPADDGGSIAAALARLASAIERLEAKVDALAGGGVALPVAAEPPMPRAATAAGDDDDLAAHGEWLDLLDRLPDDPQRTLQEAELHLQTADGEHVQAIRAIAGTAASRCGRYEAAVRHLRSALDSPEPLPSDLRELAATAYEEAALGLIDAECGPESPVRTVRDLRDRLVAELWQDEGFDDARIGSGEARARLEFLVKDPVLRSVARLLADYCRVAHLLNSVRSGMWMAHERVADVLREDDLGDEAFGMGLVLYANVLMDADGASDWVWRWPVSDGNVLAAEGSRLTQRALEVLPRIDRDLSGPAALSLLACLAPTSLQHVTMEQRRRLVDFLRPGEPARSYAEFLAAYRPAYDGVKFNARQYPGFVETLAKIRLGTSSTFLEHALLSPSDTGPNSAARAIVDSAYLRALALGIDDAQSQVVDLLDLLMLASKPDNLLNELSDMVEDRLFPGAEMLSLDQCILVYRQALRAALTMGHDEDARRAFFRLVRTYAEAGDDQALLELSGELVQGKFRPLRVPALMVHIETLLDQGGTVERVLELAEPFVAGKRTDDVMEVQAELAGLAEVFPAHSEALRAFLAEHGLGVPEDEGEPSFPDAHVVVVGGHPRLQQHASAVLRDRWGMRVDWLGPDEAKQGQRLPSLIGGACDFVLINTAYVSHAASGRAEREAASAGKDVVRNSLNGVGSLLGLVLAQMGRQGEAPKSLKAPDKVRGRR